MKFLKTILASALLGGLLAVSVNAQGSSSLADYNITVKRKSAIVEREVIQLMADMDDFITKYSLMRVLAPTYALDPETESMRISPARASVNISAHDLPDNGMLYFDANGNEIFVKKGSTFKITAKWTGGPKYGCIKNGL